VFHLFQAWRSQTRMCNAHQIAGVIGTGLFLGLGQLLATTGPLGVLLVFLLVGSVAFAFVLSSVVYSRSDCKAVHLQLNSVCHGNGCIRSCIWVLHTLWYFGISEVRAFG
jgi:L-asparagine transporter-like permease